jgi:tRNA G10  N-methylase Trm11
MNRAMQYLEIRNTTQSTTIPISRRDLVRTAHRCSLVHAIYEVVARGNTMESLAATALSASALHDMYRGKENANASWCLRVRHFGTSAGDKHERMRVGEQTARSMEKERAALHFLKPLLMQVGGRVDLHAPDAMLCVLDGLSNNKVVLARRLATGPRVSIMNPNTRICVTNTPLWPIAAYSMCNIAGIRAHDAILDPYAGSASILLAAALIEPTIQSVGIEIAQDRLVNRADIRNDFTTRGLKEPAALLRGDSTLQSMRDEARAIIGGRPFDAIITDPPYGIRESTVKMDPISELLAAIETDRKNGRPLLKIGGKLVCFIPCADQDNIQDLLPTDAQLEKAGLLLDIMKEQPLNSRLSRWLVSFLCVR